MAQKHSSESKKSRKQQQAPPKMNVTDGQTRPDVQGWGADLDPADRPAVPMERTPPRFMNVHYDEIEQQPVNVEVFHSIERPDVTPIFGATAPPRGASGMIRRFAYKISENDIRRWMLLLFADRVDMVEGILEDLGRGHIPNIFAEMGLKSELKYNKKSFFTKVAVAAGAFGLAAYWVQRGQRRREGPLDAQWAAGNAVS